jgi:hypothetical protein
MPAVVGVYTDTARLRLPAALLRALYALQLHCTLVRCRLDSRVLRAALPPSVEPGGAGLQEAQVVA